MNINKVLIVFKTHLDIGFTDFSSNVIKKYKEVFIPNAIKTARELREKNSEASFRWTTGSWLIYEYLKDASPERRKDLVNAIENGDISWHGLPFTTHTELMSKELFEYGVGISQKLDKMFNKKTAAAKMTDVPGHTKAMIPLLKKAGIELLHIGVNPASAVPDVPEIFRWTGDNGESINVIYNGEYGNFTKLGDTGVALYFAHTNDNLGGQTSEEVEETFKKLGEAVPGAELVAADLNDAAVVLREIENELPSVTDEIGDSWIHGVGSDPKKVSEFKALERVFAELPDCADKEILGDGLLIIPEHTWGLDEKTHLNDKVNFSRLDFNAHRNDGNFKKMELSWQEQRCFMYDAVSKLSENIRKKCEKALKETVPQKVDTDRAEKIPTEKIISKNGCKILFNENGEIIYLEKDGRVISDKNHKLLSVFYEQFCYDDYVRFHFAYHRIEDDWAWEDFTKIGMENASPEYMSFKPKATVYDTNSSVTVNYIFSETASHKTGVPGLIQAVISFDEEIKITVSMFNKPANRIAEALWLGFSPNDANPLIGKLGTFINPYSVVSRGGRNLHATDYGVKYDRMRIESADCALVSPGTPHLVDFVNKIPDRNEGIFFNLYNNVWGTNFPMWYDDDTQFRFVIKI